MLATLKCRQKYSAFQFCNTSTTPESPWQTGVNEVQLRNLCFHLIVLLQQTQEI